MRNVQQMLIAAGMLAAVLSTPMARANIDLEWRPLDQTVHTGETARIGLYAVSDSPVDQYFSAAQVIIGWDPNCMDLTGLDQAGSVPLYASSFPPDDAFGLNEAVPPADGDGLWVGLAFPGVLPATPAGSLLTSLLFQALGPVAGTNVTILISGGSPTGYTKVIGEIPNLNVLGTIGAPATVTILPEPTAGLLALSVALLWSRRVVR
jgi:hypothetical protein